MAALAGSIHAMGAAGRRGVPFMELVAAAFGGSSGGGGVFISAAPDLPQALNLFGRRPFGSVPEEEKNVFSNLFQLTIAGADSAASHGPSTTSLAKYFAPGCVFPSMISQAGRTGCDKKAWSEFGDLPLEGLASIQRTASSDKPFRHFNIVCLGTAAGFLLFSHNKSNEKQSEDPYGLNEEIPDDKDPIKETLKLLKKLASKFSKFPDPVAKGQTWYIQLIEDIIGPSRTGQLLAAARFLRDRWREFYLVILTGVACWGLNINIFQGPEIIFLIISEKSEEIRQELESYVRKAQKKNGDCYSAEMIISYTSYDLYSKEVCQMVVLSNEIEEAWVRGLIGQVQQNQPSLPKCIHPALRQFLKGQRKQQTSSPSVRRPIPPSDSKRVKARPDATPGGKVQRPIPSIPWRVGT